MAKSLVSCFFDSQCIYIRNCSVTHSPSAARLRIVSLVDHSAGCETSTDGEVVSFNRFLAASVTLRRRRQTRLWRLSPAAIATPLAQGRDGSALEGQALVAPKQIWENCPPHQ